MPNTQPGPWQRFMDSYIHAAVNSPLGGGGLARAYYHYVKGVPQEAITRAVQASNQDYDKKYDKAPTFQHVRSGHPLDYVSPDNIGRGATSLLASVLGGVDPTYAVGGAGKNVVRRVASQAAVQGASSVARQKVNVNTGMQKKIDPKQVLEDAATGAIFQGLHEGGAAAVHAVGKFAKPPVINAEDFHETPPPSPAGQRQSLVSPTSEVAPIAPDGLPGNGSVRPMDPETIARVMNDPEAARGKGADVVPMPQRRINGRDRAPNEPISPEDLAALPPANREYLDATADKPVVDNTGYEAHTPNIEEPATPANNNGEEALVPSTPEGPRQHKNFTEVQPADDQGNMLIHYKASNGETLPIKMGIDPDGTAEIAIDQFSTKANRLGPKEIRSAMTDLMDMYPEIQRFGGYRRSGAGAGRVQEIEPKRPESITAEDMVDPVADKPQVNDSLPEQPYVNNIADQGHPAPANDVSRLDAAKNFAQNLMSDERGSLGYKEEGAEPAQPEEPLTPAQRMANAIVEAKPLRWDQNSRMSQERAKRVEAGLQKYQQVGGGEQGIYAKMSALKGALPGADFAPIRDQFSDEEIHGMLDTIEQDKNHPPLTKLSAQKALLELLDGNIPGRKTLTLLQNFFPEMEKVGKDQGWWDKMKDAFTNVAAMPRSIEASSDMSGPRQAIATIGTKQFWKNVPVLWKAYGSDFYNKVQEEIAARPNYPLMQASGLELTKIGRKLEDREEQFMSAWAEKIPMGIGALIKHSDESFTAFLNRVRADTFDDWMKVANKQQLDLSMKDVKNMGKAINMLTGRGDLGKLNQAAGALSSIFFAPRLMAARVATFWPGTYVKMDRFTRIQTCKTLLSSTGVLMGALGMAKLAGADVNVTDPTNPDFLKIKVGNTRFDPTGGYQPYVRAFAQIILQKKTSSTTGNVNELNTGDYGSKSGSSVAIDFARHKVSPFAGQIWDAVDGGRDSLGKKNDYTTLNPFENRIAKDFIPLIESDAYEAYKENGPIGLAAAVPDVFGVGVQTYGADEGKSSGRPRKDEFKDDFDGDFKDDFKDDF